jgi:hypothetical protein
VPALEPEHARLDWPRRWPLWGTLALGAIVAASSVAVTRDGRVTRHPRWDHSVHRFTWGAGIEAIRPARTPPPAVKAVGGAETYRQRD